ncbi:MAG: type VI secretion system contractile sheath large subunit [Bryobacterales bacterium]|nr:type VI secretion system contractile sheath large subunit [Bryobacterales bacterium]
MTIRENRAEMHFEVEPGSRAAQVIDDSRVFRILLLGDFSGKEGDARGPLHQRRPVEVDRDTFDDVLAAMRPTVMVGLDGEEPFPLKVADLDDFRPEAIFHKNPLFLEMRRLRDQLEDPDRWRAAARDLGSGADVAPASPATPPPATPAKVSARDLVSGGSLLDAMMEDAQSDRPAPALAPSKDPVLEIARRAVLPYLVSAPSAQQQELLARMDEAISAQMRRVLHHPVVRRVESAWRGLFRLIRALDTGAHLKVSILDLSREELQLDLFGHDDPAHSLLARVLIADPGKRADGQGYSVVAGAYRFGADADDLRALNRLMKFAKSAGAPFLADATPSLVGAPAFEGVLNPRAWTPASEVAGGYWPLVRKQADAAWLGLVAPRVLSRLPYGRKSDPCDAFPFEEIAGQPSPDDYLWGSGAVCMAMLLGQAYAEFGWDFKPGAVAELTGLPLHTYSSHEGTVSTSVAEAWFTEEAMEALSSRGFITLVPYKNQDRLRVFQMNSIADPYRLIQGPWSV